MVDGSTDNEKLLSICFRNNILLTVFDVHFLGYFSEHRVREKEQKSLLLLNIALHQSARKKSLNYRKKEFGKVIIFLVEGPCSKCSAST